LVFQVRQCQLHQRDHWSWTQIRTVSDSFSPDIWQLVLLANWHSWSQRYPERDSLKGKTSLGTRKSWAQRYDG
jgi:hypothetical protein